MNQETQNPVKKVLFLITKATWGGAQRYIYDLATHLPADQYKPIVAYGKEGQLANMLLEKKIELATIPFLSRDVAIFDDVQSFFSVMDCIKKIKPDILHLNSSKAAALGALAGRLSGVRKIIFTVHGWPFKEDRNSISKFFIYWISWFTAYCSHAVIVISKDDETIGKRMPGIGEKITYVPLGINPPEFMPREEALRLLQLKTNTDKVGAGAVRIGTIAELTRNKGIRYMIEAMNDLQRERDENFVYLIFGDGEEREELRHVTRVANVLEKVFFLGFVPNASRYLKAIDVFVLPSLKEGMPYALLEAMEAGVPIITTHAVSDEIALTYPDVRFVQSKNSFALADMIRDDREAHKNNPPKMSDTPRAQYFPLTRMTQDTIALY